MLHEYLFDVSVDATFRVKAESEDAAREKLSNYSFEHADTGLDLSANWCLKDGRPVLVEVDGEEPQEED